MVITNAVTHVTHLPPRNYPYIESVYNFDFLSQKQGSYTHIPLKEILKNMGKKGNRVSQTPSYQCFQPLPVKNPTGNSKNENRCNAVTATVTAVTRK